MVVNFIFAVAVDKLMYGINAGKLALIVTEHGTKICEVIDECCQRGTTILKGQGGYNGNEKQVVMCACSNKEMFHVQQAVKKADPESFLIVLESNEVHGEGLDNILKAVVNKWGNMLYCLVVRILIENIEVQLNDKGDGEV